MNDADLLKLLDSQPGNLLARLQSLDTPEQIAEELYVSVLSRLPSQDEVAELTNQLQHAGVKKEFALKQFAWALLASTEFCVNH